jgi:hypothetical protein
VFNLSLQRAIPDNGLLKSDASTNDDVLAINGLLQNLPGKKLSDLPRQDNHCDCGLFLLTYIEYFTYGAPDTIELEAFRSKEGKVQSLV